MTYLSLSLFLLRMNGLVFWVYFLFHMIMCDLQWRIHVKFTNGNGGDNYHLTKHVK